LTCATPARYERINRFSDDTMSHTPRLCIGLPVYNGENYVAASIESILAQTFTDFRFIISDNASTDGTEEICRAFSRQDARIEYHRAAQNRGAAWNLNHVARLADSEYFKWMMHDDVCAPELVQRCVEHLDARPGVVLCHTKSSVMDAQGTVLGSYENRVKATALTPCERFTDLLWHLGLCHMLLGVIRHAVLRETVLHGAYARSDYILLAELALRGQFHEVDEPLFFRRDHEARPARAQLSAAAHAEWYDPANAGKIQMVHWTLLANYLRVIARVPISLDQKVRCLYPLARWVRWNAPALRRDLADGATLVLRRAIRPSPARDSLRRVR
jgi:glycosyltransferase involved in cell wall biosynthesis